MSKESLIERMETILTRRTHINSPSEGSNRTSYDRILVDCDNFRVLEDAKCFLSSVGQLNKVVKYEGGSNECHTKSACDVVATYTCTLSVRVDLASEI